MPHSMPNKFSILDLNEYLCPIFQIYTELNMQEKIIILDFGSQTTQLIGRRVRELNMYCEIVPYNKFPFGDPSVIGVILSGSPFSVYDEKAFKIDLSDIRGKYPILGICYGAQFMAYTNGGKVEPRPRQPVAERRP